MSKYIRYYTGKYNTNNFQNFIEMIKSNGFEGIILALFKDSDTIKKYKYKTDIYPQINKMIEIAENSGLETAVHIDVFNSYLLWQHSNFSAPTTHAGINFNPDSNYYPICPNNPLSINRFNTIIEKLAKINTNYIILDNFSFPFYWEKENLDIQHKTPPYCYCPFCLAEFSTEIGSIVTNNGGLFEVLPEWLEWRTNVIYKYFIEFIESLSENDQLVISTPPLYLIDIPFTTGQLPLSFSEAETKISPKLFYHEKNKERIWATNILNLYNLDLPKEYVVPAIRLEKSNMLKNLPFDIDDHKDIFIY